MSIYVLTFVIFIVLAAVFELLLYAWRGSLDVSRAKAISRRLEEYALPGGWSFDSGDIIKTRVLSSIPLLDRLLAKLDGISRMETLLRQARARHTPAVYLMLAGLLGISGYLAGAMLLHNRALAAAAAGAGVLLPFCCLHSQKASRMKKFDTQLPEALDLIARSLKAGHAFTSGLKLAADGFPDPLGTEFSDTINEINFGLSVPEALKNLGRRMESPDLRYFVVSTILQRETGGNLAEITESISRMIRDRFKFNDKVRVLAAEGKMSAAILIALPFALFALILKVNPGYVEILLRETAGKIGLAGAVLLMALGIGIILKMIKVNV